MSAHTPGPWFVAEGANHEGDYAPAGSVRNETWWIAKVEDAPEAEANARLIAAAPELLEALRKIEQGEGRFSRDPLTHASNTIEDMIAVARAAIAKAEAQ
jgi:hypothetical protein